MLSPVLSFSRVRLQLQRSCIESAFSIEVNEGHLQQVTRSEVFIIRVDFKLLKFPRIEGILLWYKMNPTQHYPPFTPTNICSYIGIHVKNMQSESFSIESKTKRDLDLFSRHVGNRKRILLYSKVPILE